MANTVRIDLVVDSSGAVTGVKAAGTAFEKMATKAKKAQDQLMKTQQQLAAVGQGLSTVGRGMTAAITLPLTLAAGAAIKFASDFESSMTASMAIMGDLGTETVEQFDEMKVAMEDTARSVAKETIFSATEAADSYFFLASAGLDAAASIGALPLVSKFAQAGMFDMATATDLLTDAQSALGLTIRDTDTQAIDVTATMEGMARVSDVLVKANTLANASVEQFSIALTTRAGTALKLINKDVEEGVAVLAAFADQGIKGQMAGQQLGIVLRDLSTKAIKNKEDFERQGIAVFDTSGRMNNMADIIEDLEDSLIGASAETQKAILLQLGFSDRSVASLQALIGLSDQIRNYEAELRKAGGTTEEIAAKQLASFENQMKLTKAAIIDVAITLGNTMLPILRSFVDDVVAPGIEKLAGMAEAFADWPPFLQKATFAVAGLAAAMGPAIMIMGQFAFAASSLAGAFATLGGKTALAGITAKLGGVIPALTGAAAGTAALSVAAVGAGAVIGTQLGGALLEYGDKLRGVDDATREAVRNVGLIEGALSLIGPVFTGIADLAVDFGQGVMEAVSAIPGAAKAVEVAIFALTAPFKAASFAASQFGDAIAWMGAQIFEAEDKQSKVIQTTATLAQASKLAGEIITDEARAMEIINAELKNLQGTTEGAAEATKEMIAAAFEAEEAQFKAAQAAAAAAEAQKEFDEAVQGVAASLKTSVAAAREANVITAAIASIGGVAQLTKDGVEDVANSLEVLAANGASVEPLLAQVKERMAEFDEFKPAALAQEVAIFSAAIEGIGPVSELSADGAMKLAEMLATLEEQTGALPPELQALKAELSDLGFDEAGAAVREFVAELEKAGFDSQAQRVQTLTKGVQQFGGVAALTAKQIQAIATEAEGLVDAGEDVGKTLQEIIKEAERLGDVDATEKLTAQFTELNGVMSEDTARSLQVVEDSILAAMEAGEGATQEFQDAAIAALDDIAAKSPEAAAAVELIKDEFGLASSSAIDFGGIMADLSNIMQAFGVSAGSSLGIAVAGIQQLGASLPAIRDFQQSILGGEGTGAEKLQAGAGAVAGGIAGVAGATGSGGAAVSAAKGAMAGAAAGGQVGGPIGAGVGAAIGGLVGFFRGRGREQLASEIRDSVGATVSEELAKAIKEGAEAAGRTIEQESLLNLGDIIAQEGFEAFEDGVAGASEAAVKLLTEVAAGTLPVEEGLAEVGEAFGLMAQESFEAGKVADAALLNIVMATRELGQEVPEVAAFVSAALQEAAEGIGKFVGGIQIVDPQDAQDQATIFAGAFFATMESEGLLAAVDAFKPAFDKLKEQLQEFGGEGVNFGGVQRLFQIAGQEEFRPLLEGVEGLNQALVGMANSGYLTADSFSAFQRQGAAAFEQLTAAGLKENEALQQMAPFLQSAIDAAERFGIPLDANTQALITQAEAAGIAFATDPMNVMADALGLIAELLGATQEQLAGLGETAAATGETLSTSLGEESTAGLNAGLAGANEQLGEIDSGLAGLSDTAATSVGEISDTFAAGGESIVAGLGPVSDALETELRNVGTETAAALDSAFDSTNKAIEEGLGAVADTFTGPVVAGANAAVTATMRIADAAREAARAAAEIEFPDAPRGDGGGGGGGGGGSRSTASGFGGLVGATTRFTVHPNEFVSVIPAGKTNALRAGRDVSAQGGFGGFNLQFGDINLGGISAPVERDAKGEERIGMTKQELADALREIIDEDFQGVVTDSMREALFEQN
jgi:TP901 family phage tail tape measure protein